MSELNLSGRIGLFFQFKENMLAGKCTLHDYKAAFNDIVDHAEEVKAELSKLTVAQLFKLGGGMFEYRNRGDKKDSIVKAMYSEMLTDFSLGKPISMAINLNESHEQQMIRVMRGIVEAQTLDTIQEYNERVIRYQEERAAEVQRRAEALENPKTLSDFVEYISAKMKDGLTSKQARETLSFEQREEFDRLTAERSRERREQEKKSKAPKAEAASQTTGGEIIETKHTKTGEDLFVVQLDERVSHEDYKILLANAKRLGGYYSSYRGNGAVPGFTFREREHAEGFLKVAQGETEEAQATMQERRNAFEDDRRQTAVERLSEMADKLEADAEASLHKERKVNTAKRMREAASADKQAYADKALAQTMRNVAAAIEDGSAVYLRELRAKSQLEMLRSALRVAKHYELQANYPHWGDYMNHSADPVTSATVEYSEFPTFTMHRSQWAELARKLTELPGVKNIGKKLLDMADDVTDAYLKFARENLSAVSTFRTKSGDLPVLRSRKDAELSILESGFEGQAIVLPVKKGENRIILSPAAAMKRGIWQGDDDKPITVKPDLVEEIVGKIGIEAKELPWHFRETYRKRKALARMNIETAAEFRMALRELAGFLDDAKPDKLRELEREVRRDSIRNRGYLDFFPTPAAVVDMMLTAARLEEGMTVLEPSAGMGNIADRLREEGFEPKVCELEPLKREFLEAKGYDVVCKDFLEYSGETFDRIVMNPPFSNRLDTVHVRHAFDLLNPGGRLVAIVCEGSFYGQDKKAEEFRAWLDDMGGYSEKLPDGSFNDRTLPVTTGVNTRMVVINKYE